MNYYAAVIGLLAEETDWKPVVTRIAMKHPKAVYDAIESPGKSLDSILRAQVLAGKKISAIKLCRAEKGIGLKEAKDYVESL